MPVDFSPLPAGRRALAIFHSPHSTPGSRAGFADCGLTASIVTVPVACPHVTAMTAAPWQLPTSAEVRAQITVDYPFEPDTPSAAAVSLLHSLRALVPMDGAAHVDDGGAPSAAWVDEASAFGLQTPVWAPWGVWGRVDQYAAAVYAHLLRDLVCTGEGLRYDLVGPAAPPLGHLPGASGDALVRVTVTRVTAIL